MSFKLYGRNAGSPLRCHWIMHELGLPFEMIALDMHAKEHKAPEYLAINPTGQVPTLDHDGFILAESLAINDYLIEYANSDLAGANAQERAKVWQWSLWTILNAQPELLSLAMPKWTGIPLTPENDAAVRAKLDKHLQILEARLGASAYLAGDRFTVADINAATAIGYASYSGFDLGVYPAITKWLETLTSRPAYLAAKA
ncbi:MAG: glutathione S-transferase family protein [Candidatus Uhrbacteria bacterium]